MMHTLIIAYLVMWAPYEGLFDWAISKLTAIHFDGVGNTVSCRHAFRKGHPESIEAHVLAWYSCVWIDIAAR